MSDIDPFNAPYRTLTGEIGRQMRALINLMEQHQAVHPGVRPLYIWRLVRLADAWDQMPYPKEVENPNETFV